MPATMTKYTSTNRIEFRSEVVPVSLPTKDGRAVVAIQRDDHVEVWIAAHLGSGRYSANEYSNNSLADDMDSARERAKKWGYVIAQAPASK